MYFGSLEWMTWFHTQSYLPPGVPWWHSYCSGLWRQKGHLLCYWSSHSSQVQASTGPALMPSSWTGTGLWTCWWWSHRSTHRAGFHASQSRLQYHQGDQVGPPVGTRWPLCYFYVKSWHTVIFTLLYYIAHLKHVFATWCTSYLPVPTSSCLHPNMTKLFFYLFIFFYLSYDVWEKTQQLVLLNCFWTQKHLSSKRQKKEYSEGSSKMAKIFAGISQTFTVNRNIHKHQDHLLIIQSLTSAGPCYKKKINNQGDH